METVNVQAFLLGVIFLTAGGYLAFDMQDDTSWTTYSSDRSGEFSDGDFWYEYDVTIEMEIGLQDTTYSEKGEECSDSKWCDSIDVDLEFETMDNPFALEANGGPIDCETTKKEADIQICETASAGSKTHTLVNAGLGLLGLTVLLSVVGLFGYVPGKILKLISSISSIVIFTGPIIWYFLMPDLNADLSATENQWGLSKGFYLTLISSPLIFVGGVSMEKWKLMHLKRRMTGMKKMIISSMMMSIQRIQMHHQSQKLSEMQVQLISIWRVFLMKKDTSGLNILKVVMNGTGVIKTLGAGFGTEQLTIAQVLPS